MLFALYNCVEKSEGGTGESKMYKATTTNGHKTSSNNWRRTSFLFSVMPSCKWGLGPTAKNGKLFLRVFKIIYVFISKLNY
jgi:hypothetical protein